MLNPPQNDNRSHQLGELLRDSDFERLIDLITKEVEQLWDIPCNAARGFALSAIGEPGTIAGIHDAWSRAKRGQVSLGWTKQMVRWRVIDLLRKDARRANHCSLSTEPANDVDVVGSVQAHALSDPRVQFEQLEIIRMVRAALACFARPGLVPERHALLLHRYALEEMSYVELNAGLQCTANALRVRVHKALRAFRRHVNACHPELAELLERTRRS